MTYLDLVCAVAFDLVLIKHLVEAVTYRASIAWLDCKIGVVGVESHDVVPWMNATQAQQPTVTHRQQDC